jgi:hypothetical protein
MSSITLARVYQQSFQAYPHFTLAVAGGALTALGDAVAQFSQHFVRFPPHTLISINICRSHLEKTTDEFRTTTLLALFASFALGLA